MSEALEIKESEFDGFFLEITFDGEDEATMLFVADKDFESLKEMARDEEADWQDFKNELMELLEHSGHEEDHELSESTTEEIREVIAER